MANTILFISSYPPRECGIANYSIDLIDTLKSSFGESLNVKICALENDEELNFYKEEVAYVLNTDHKESYANLVNQISGDYELSLIIIQHEFGFFAKHEENFLDLLSSINLPILIVFHTVLPCPNIKLKTNVISISNLVSGIIVMTHNSKNILVQDYQINQNQIMVISHGTHLANHYNKDELKSKFELEGRLVVSTFGLLGSGKNIETTLKALPSIIKEFPKIAFLIIGKTHPTILKWEGELYRNSLLKLVDDLNLQGNVIFINKYLPLDELLEYLQLTDIYLFTSKDRNQAVSGTFSYALSMGCPIISTPIPHALEVLKDDAGIIIDFENEAQLANAVIELFKNKSLSDKIAFNALHRISSTAWQNSAIAHLKLIQTFLPGSSELIYSVPEINLNHVIRMTTPIGIIQFSKFSEPDLSSGFTLDDNARALIAMGKLFEQTNCIKYLDYIEIYYAFIKKCLHQNNQFSNYMNSDQSFSNQNFETNLADANGRAIWALGYLMHLNLDEVLRDTFLDVGVTFNRAIQNADKIHSTRAMAFVIKGLYYATLKSKSNTYPRLIALLANRMVQMYKHEQEEDWHWFESYFTYANSVLAEAMLCAWMVTNDIIYYNIAIQSFDFLLSKIMYNDQINVVLNKSWLYKLDKHNSGGLGAEQPIDVAYTILALNRFYTVTNETRYKNYMIQSFNWFLGKNKLNQIVYNPSTGGCYDGIEDSGVNLNQGAESTLSYLLSRLTIDFYIIKNKKRAVSQAALH